jgi:hypothetical protein
LILEDGTETHGGGGFRVQKTCECQNDHLFHPSGALDELAALKKRVLELEGGTKPSAPAPTPRKAA